MAYRGIQRYIGDIMYIRSFVVIFITLFLAGCNTPETAEERLADVARPALLDHCASATVMKSVAVPDATLYRVIVRHGMGKFFIAAWSGRSYKTGKAVRICFTTHIESERTKAAYSWTVMK